MLRIGQGKMIKASFASLAYDSKKKKTRREEFLEEMDRVISWEELLKVIGEHYPKAVKGRHRMPVERMLRVYFMQQWYGLSDPGMEDALYDSESMRRFAGIDLQADPNPGQLDSKRIQRRSGPIDGDTFDQLALAC